MKAKELTIDAIVYFRITADDIITTRVKSISKEMDTLRIKLHRSDYSSDEYECSLDDKVAVCEGSYSTKTVYFNREDAEKVQMRLRRDLIKSAHDSLQKSLERYNEQIDKYFNKPVSAPVSIEFYEKQK